ncbi:MAG: MASE3 domain-containing protein [Anaerolineales bacterium]
MNAKQKLIPSIGLGTLLIIGLYLTSLYNFLLFHTLVEIFSIVIAYSIFILAWNSQRWIDNNYLLFIGIAYLFVGGVDLLHTFSYGGLQIFPAYGTDLPTQLWIAGRYLQAVSLLVAPFFMHRKLNLRWILVGYTVITTLLVASIFGRVFPTCHIEGVGLTPFKKISEYIISLILGLAIWTLWREEHHFDQRVLRWLTLALVFTIVSELAFTFYIGVYDFSNLIGHYFKIAAFYLIYKALIQTGIRDPYALMFHNLSQNRDKLRQERDKAQRYLDVAGTLIVALDTEGRVILLNSAGREMLGYTEEEILGQNWFDKVVPARSRPEIQAAFAQLMRGDVDGAQHFENAIVTRAGEECLILWHNTIMRNEAGEITGTLSSGQDVTARHRTEERIAWEAGVNAAMAKLAKAMITTDDLNEITALVLEKARQLTDSAFGFVGYIDPQTGYLISPTLTQGIWESCQVPDKTFIFEEFGGMWGWVLNHRAPMLTNTPQDDPRATGVPPGHIPIERFLSAPAMIGGTLMGQIALANPTRDYMERDLSALERLASLYALAVQRSRSAAALRESEQRYRMLFESAADAVFLQDLTGHFLDVNQVACQRLGYTHAELLTMSLSDIESPTYAAKIPERMEAIQREGALVFETEHVSRDGNLIPTEVSSRIIEYEGRPVQLSIARDITERKEAEEKIRRQRDLLENTIESLPHPFYVINAADYTIRIANSASGYTNGRQRVTCYELTHGSTTPCNTSQHPCPLREVQRTGRPSKVEHIHYDQNHQPRNVEVHSYPIFNDEGEVQQMIEYTLDITERKRAEAALREAKDAAEAANRAKSIFLANMSHELRTPLNAILGFSQLMARDMRLEAEQQENLDIISQSGEHLLALINDVLTMSKIEAGRIILNEKTFDLFRLLSALEEMFTLRAREKGLALIFDFGEDVPRYIHADENKLRQVLINLLSNAVKFTSEGGVTLRIATKPLKAQPTQPLSAAESRGTRSQGPGEDNVRLYFEVEDTGVGIAPDEIDQLFDPFAQTQSGQAAQEGTGLGLAISQKFIHLMGGQLKAISKVGQGSLFKFSVVVQPTSVTALQAKQRRQVVGIAPDQPIYRLLIVEDRDASRKLLLKLLRPLGFQLRAATNGKQAIEIWQNWNPHVILMDMRMPVMDGYEATRHIKSTAQGQATVIIALTASAFEEDRQLILSEGCNDFISKPFRESEIFEKLHQHLGVDFIYHEHNQPPSSASEEEELKIPLTAWDEVPPTLIAKLRQAIIQAEFNVIATLMAEVSSYAPDLAATLTELAYNFEYDQLLALIPRAGETAEAKDNAIDTSDKSDKIGGQR